jgi:3-hydroxyisobutyrate dehydrogenase-like beta-hydroxyacid dehydrogenase
LAWRLELQRSSPMGVPGPHQRVAALLSAGVRGVERLADLADCDVVLTSLPDDDALSGVALGPTGLAAILTPNAVHISTSTVSPPVSRHVAKEHASHGQDYVAPPVLGSPDFARERKLFVLAARLPPAMLKVVPLLERLGQRVFVIGEEPALANLVKLAANVLHRDDARMHGRGVGLDAKRRG